MQIFDRGADVDSGSGIDAGAGVNKGTDAGTGADDLCRCGCLTQMQVPVQRAMPAVFPRVLHHQHFGLLGQQGPAAEGQAAGMLEARHASQGLVPQPVLVQDGDACARLELTQQEAACGCCSSIPTYVALCVHTSHITGIFREDTGRSSVAVDVSMDLAWSCM